MTASAESEPIELPDVIARYLTAHAQRDVDTALATFGSEPVVVDDGRTYRGLDGVEEFLRRAGAEFTYTTTLTGSEHADAHRWVVTNHLEGDFPGGVADLTYRFTVEHDRITALEIGV